MRAAQETGPRPVATPVRVVGRLALVLAVLALLSVTARGIRHDVYTQDTLAVTEGSQHALDCLADRTLVRCSYHPETRTSDVNPYPLLQYLLAVPATVVGVPEGLRQPFLIWCNTLATAAVAALVIVRARRVGGGPHAVLAAVLAGSGMLVAYAFHSFGEPLAVLAVAGVCVAALGSRASPWLLPAALLATVSKETLFPMVLLFGLGCIELGAAGPPQRREARRRLVAGVVAGVLLNVLFNLFRYGSVLNVAYFDQSPGISVRQTGISALGLLFSPSGGLLWFWPAVVGSVVLLAVVALRHRTAGGPEDRGVRRRRGAQFVVVAFVLGWLSLATWWIPYGWIAWGPRLFLPFCLPPIIALMEVTAGRAPLARVGATVAVVVVCGLSVIPNLAAVWSPSTSKSMIDATTVEHVECRDNNPRRDADAYNHCLNIWSFRVADNSIASTVGADTGAERVWFWATALLAVGAIASGMTWRVLVLNPAR